ncbi:proline dehydrogenase family protein [Candidatus Woesearchaeota archaeon]|nr:proline dehydrogenase family protein [Candidatus Woesearchaeota archaeon]
MLRSVLLKLSQSKKAKDSLMKLGAFRRAKERFVAGETLDELVNVVRKLNNGGFKTSVDYLGENVSSAAAAEANKAMYFSLLDRIAVEKLDSHVSVKLTALGLDIAQELCEQNLTAIVQKAEAIGSFVRVDMENSLYTQRTLQLYRSLRRNHTGAGVVIQSSLYRSRDDVAKLLAGNIATVRLCKGAYLESSDIAYARKKDVDSNYLHLAKMLLDAGGRVAFATHDETMIHAIKKYTNETVEFQMLYGIRTDLQRQLAAEGYPVRIYVPFGKDWYGYFLRRLAERPANVWFVAKNFLK